MKKIFLFLFSILIYIYFGSSGILFLLFNALSSFYVTKFFNGKYKRIWLLLFLGANIGILLTLKFQEVFHFTNIIAPLGISYYTLQVISYVVDVYRGKIEREQNLLTYLLYVFYFPYLFIGPISRFSDVKEDLISNKIGTKQEIWDGLVRILWGLFKKLVIANRIAMVTSLITSDISLYRGSYVLLACFLYSIQLYADFSGGIDMVLGLSNCFGIHLKENFRSPFQSESVKEFWNRWHIALSTWLKDYVYIPLGGNRCSKIRQKFNVFVTFFVSGLWHGTSYLLWGVCHGIFVAFSRFFSTKSQILNQLITFVLVSLVWVFFLYPTSALTASKMFLSIFTTGNYLALCQNILSLTLDIGNWIVLLLSVFLLFLYDFRSEKWINFWKRSSIEWKTFVPCVLILVILLFGVYGIGFEVTDFIYSKF